MMTKIKLFFLIGLAFSFYSCSDSMGSQSKEGLKVGDKAKDFSLKNVDGKMMSLKSFKDAKGYIVVFTCNECPYAKLYEDRIIALHNKYASKGFPVVAINPNNETIQPGDSFEMMQVRAKSKEFPFPYLRDETQDIARFYGARKTPHIYLLKNNLEVAYIGGIDDNPQNSDKVEERYLENAVDALLANKEVQKNVTKAIGCTIKWKES